MSSQPIDLQCVTKKDAITHETSSKCISGNTDSDATPAVWSTGLTEEKFGHQVSLCSWLANPQQVTNDSLECFVDGENDVVMKIGSPQTVAPRICAYERGVTRGLRVRADSSGEPEDVLDTLINTESAVHTHDLECRCGGREMNASNNLALSTCSKCSSTSATKGMSPDTQRMETSSRELYTFKSKAELLNESFDVNSTPMSRGWNHKTSNGFQRSSPIAIPKRNSHNGQAAYARRESNSYTYSMMEGH